MSKLVHILSTNKPEISKVFHYQQIVNDLRASPTGLSTVKFLSQIRPRRQTSFFLVTWTVNRQTEPSKSAEIDGRGSN